MEDVIYLTVNAIHATDLKVPFTAALNRRDNA